MLQGASWPHVYRETVQYLDRCIIIVPINRNKVCCHVADSGRGLSLLYHYAFEGLADQTIHSSQQWPLHLIFLQARNFNIAHIVIPSYNVHTNSTLIICLKTTHDVRPNLVGRRLVSQTYSVDILLGGLHGRSVMWLIRYTKRGWCYFNALLHWLSDST